jgi:hypothetical protein
MNNIDIITNKNTIETAIKGPLYLLFALFLPFIFVFVALI